MEERIDALAGDDGEGRIGTDDRQEGFVIDVEGFGFGGVFGLRLVGETPRSVSLKKVKKTLAYSGEVGLRRR